VGLLVGGYDVSGPHLYNTCPSGNYYEYKAMAIGARAQVWARSQIFLYSVHVDSIALLFFQAAKTYLEKHLESFPSASLDEMIRHGLRAIQACLQDTELSSANSSIAIVGKDMPFTILEDAALEPYVSAVKEEDQPMTVDDDGAAAVEEDGVSGDEIPAVEAAAAAAVEEDEGTRPMEI
jgi:20S proteasome subunit alpha 6